MIALLLITDGRHECLERTLVSAAASLLGPITRIVAIDDSADAEHTMRLTGLVGQLNIPHAKITAHPERQGFAAAIQSGWMHLYDGPEPFVFHLEQDFTFNRTAHLGAMAEVLTEHPHLVQLALRRQPWNDDERAAGGIVEQHPDDYEDRSDRHGHEWLEHRRFFTTNPSLYRRELCARGWPQVRHSEGIFTHHLLEDPDVRFGFWGPRHSGEWVRHIGNERVGCGY